MLLPQRLAWQFIQSSIHPSGRIIQPELTHLTRPDTALKALRFNQSFRRDSTPVVVVLNGYSARGYRDPRMQRAASNLAALGFDVYMPILDSVESLRLHPTAVDEIAGFIVTLAAQKREKVGVFSASISASLSLVACARPEVRKSISGIMAIGPYGHLKRAVSHVMLNSRDDYGRFIVWMNFADWVVGQQPGLQLLFRTAIDDEGWKRKHPHLPAQLAKADPQIRALFRRFVYDQTYREMRWQQVCQQFLEDQQWIRLMNPADHIQQLGAPLFLLHGQNDDVILPSESEELFQLLKRYNQPGRILLSPLISHADLVYSWKTPFHGLQLMRLFAGFFESVWEGHGQVSSTPNDQEAEGLFRSSSHVPYHDQPETVVKTGLSSLFKAR